MKMARERRKELEEKAKVSVSEEANDPASAAAYKSSALLNLNVRAEARKELRHMMSAKNNRSI